MGKPMEDLRDAIAATGTIVPLQVDTKGGGVGGSLMCRPVPGQESRWLSVMKEMLLAASPIQGVNLHVGKRYVLKNGQMVFGWYVGLACSKAAQLREAVNAISSAIDNLPEVEAQPAPARAPPPPKPGPVRTSASPRAPDYEPPRPVPVNVDVRLRTVMDTTRPGADGKPVRMSIQEIPLPHIYGELNKENSKGRGVIGGADSMPRILRNR